MPVVTKGEMAECLSLSICLTVLVSNRDGSSVDYVVCCMVSVVGLRCALRLPSKKKQRGAQAETTVAGRVPQGL